MGVLCGCYVSILECDKGVVCVVCIGRSGFCSFIGCVVAKDSSECANFMEDN